MSPRLPAVAVILGMIGLGIVAAWGVLSTISRVGSVPFQ
jgi:hypothetical protein